MLRSALPHSAFAALFLILSLVQYLSHNLGLNPPMSRGYGLRLAFLGLGTALGQGHWGNSMAWVPPFTGTSASQVCMVHLSTGEIVEICPDVQWLPHVAKRILWEGYQQLKAQGPASQAVVRVPDLQKACRISDRHGMPFLIPLHCPPHVSGIAERTGLVDVTPDGAVTLTAAGAEKGAAAAHDVFCAAETTLRLEFLLSRRVPPGLQPLQDSLRKLADLRRNGTITEEEYHVRRGEYADKVIEHAAARAAAGAPKGSARAGGRPVPKAGGHPAPPPPDLWWGPPPSYAESFACPLLSGPGPADGPPAGPRPRPPPRAVKGPPVADKEGAAVKVQPVPSGVTEAALAAAFRRFGAVLSAALKPGSPKYGYVNFRKADAARAAAAEGVVVLSGTRAEVKLR